MPDRIPAMIAVLVGMGLCVGCAVHSASGQGPRSSSTPKNSLSAAGVAFQFRYGTVPTCSTPASRDRWLARDKAQHVVFSGLWTLSTQYLLVQKADWSEGDALPASIASAAAVGLAKEGYDTFHVDETASGKDLVADAVGIGLAVGVILL